MQEQVTKKDEKKPISNTVLSDENVVLTQKDLKLNKIKWSDLVFQLRIDEVKILELVYLPSSKPITFKEIDKQIRRLNLCTKTARRKVKKLEELGLIEVIKSYGLFINPIYKIENNAIELIRQCKLKFGL